MIVKAIARKQQNSIICKVFITCASFQNSWLAFDSHELLAHAITVDKQLIFAVFERRLSQ
jgi:hypothetical protein